MTCFNRSFTERAADDAGGSIFGITDFTGFVNLLAGDAEISSGRSTVLLGNSAYSIPAVGLNLSPLLRSIVFVGKTAHELSRLLQPERFDINSSEDFSDIINRVERHFCAVRAREGEDLNLSRIYLCKFFVVKSR